MKRIFVIMTVLIMFFNPSWSQTNCIIPAPQNIETLAGEFVFTASTAIVAPAALASLADMFSESVTDLLGRKLSCSDRGKASGNIFLNIVKNQENAEAYELNILPSKIEIKASSNAGIYYGLQTLRQLLISSSGGSVKAQLVKDSPRFPWRGAMLDVSRTFMPVNLVKRYMDLFSMYKLNVLHLHLTDDQGWRVEIKRYPLLTEIGSKFDSKYNTMGGYYSQDDIRELVRYASQRNITLVPEIELPGHACAALASYPELSCAGVRPEIHTFFEGPSVHSEIFCAGKPEVYDFIFNVLDELIDLFPSKYIHIGGDEAPKDEWKKCSYCQKIIKESGLANEEELQSYFVKRIGEHLRSKNRILLGWDEIYDGGKLSGNEVLMFWRGWKAGSIEKAASSGFKIVACPTTHCYFDYDYEKIDTRKIFSYEPVPTGASPETAKNFLGVQANFWSHIDRSEDNIDKQLFPRIMGLAEAAWTIPENKNWERFKDAAAANSKYFKGININVYDDKSLK
jgi:hexosaminidase